MRLRGYGELWGGGHRNRVARSRGPLRLDYGDCAPAAERVDAGLSPKINALRGGGEGIQLSEAGPSTLEPVWTEREQDLFAGS